MDKYEELRARHLQDSKTLTKRYNAISTLRLLTALGFFWSFYAYYHTSNSLLFVPLILLPVAFLIVLRIHQKISWQKQFKKTLIKINEDELGYLEKGETSFENGLEFTDPTHAYSYDLDVFGEHSLFQNLNRTATQMGKSRLATALLSKLSNTEIIANQDALKELQSKIEWRQELLALAKMKEDSADSYKKIIEWSGSENSKIPMGINVASYIVPFLVITSLLLYFLTPLVIFGNIGLLLILLNLALLATQLRKISKENIYSGEIDKILKQYGLIIERIENESFECTRLNELKQSLHFDHTRVSAKFKQLSALFTRMDHIKNVYAGPLLNGFFLFHIHVLRSLYKWRNECSEHISQWLDVIGEFETLNSLANFSYNNANYVFPSLNEDQEVSFRDLGHPMINSGERVNNDVSFKSHQFFILTGSNMSGKSTFLRTLGINMILANCGAPVCASSATIHPFPVLVSMRVSGFPVR